MTAPARLPDDALLQRYAATENTYTDCFRLHYPHPVNLAAFVEAFYTAPLFRCERVILRFAAGRPSTDAEAEEVANGARDDFAAWQVEDRRDDQLLMRDLNGATRSWFKVVPQGTDGTLLYFGSAVTPQDGKPLGLLMRAFLPLHVLYSRLLLAGAGWTLTRHHVGR